MGGIPEIAGAIASLKAAKDIAETMVGLRDAAAFQEKRIELQSKILDAQSGMLAAQDERSALIERIRTLEEEVARLKAWEAEKQRYELKDAGNGTLAYALKEDADGAQPPHWICPQCYQDGKKSILQPETQIQGRCQVLACTRCDSELLIQGVRDLAVTRPKRRR